MCLKLGKSDLLKQEKYRKTLKTNTEEGWLMRLKHLLTTQELLKDNKKKSRLWAVSAYLGKINRRVTQQQRTDGRSSEELSSKWLQKPREGWICEQWEGELQVYSKGTSGSGPRSWAPVFQLQNRHWPTTQAWRRDKQGAAQEQQQGSTAKNMKSSDKDRYRWGHSPVGNFCVAVLKETRTFIRIIKQQRKDFLHTMQN